MYYILLLELGVCLNLRGIHLTNNNRRRVLLRLEFQVAHPMYVQLWPLIKSHFYTSKIIRIFLKKNIVGYHFRGSRILL